MNKPKAIVSWSGGKDSMLALYEARQDWDIVALLTTITEDYDRIAMHGVRTCLLDQQAEALGYPLEKVHIPPTCINPIYEARMASAMTKFKEAGISAVICGDLFLQDIRRYRETNLARLGLQGIFPLWQRDTAELANRFIDLGFEAMLCCVDTQALDGRFAGRLYDAQLLAELPPKVDPCGENGEFHTFAIDGPLFNQRLEIMTGAHVLRDNRFLYCDLLPKEEVAYAGAGSG